MHQLILDTLDPDLKAAFQADPGPVALQTALQVQMIRLLRPAAHPPLVINQEPPQKQAKGKRNH